VADALVAHAQLVPPLSAGALSHELFDPRRI